MAIAINDPITRNDIINRFNSRVRDWVTANVTLLGGTSVWNTNVNYVTSNSTAFGTSQSYSNTSSGAGYSLPGGSYNRGTYSTAEAASIATSDFASLIGASNTTAGHVVSLLKNFMVLYANTHRIQLINNGNYAYPSNSIISPGQVIYQGVARMDGVVSSVSSAVSSDVDAAANNRGIVSGNTITASQMNNFIEDCRSIWTTRALNTPVEVYRYNYCHGSCHSSFSSHGSRGRR